MIGQLSFTANFSEGRTRLSESFFTPPFNLANISTKGAGELHLMLRSTSPGILDGDDYELNMTIGDNAKVILTTQSFQRLFDMKKGAVQNTNISLAPGAFFQFISQPSVPHENSIFKADTKLYLQESATLLYGEVLTCGRAMNGEHFKFTSYQSRTTIFINGRSVCKENLCIMPEQMDISAIGLLEGHTHQASLTCVNTEDSLRNIAEQASAHLASHKELTWGFSRPANNIFVLRLLGYSAYKLYDILQDICAMSTKQIAYT